MSEQLQRPPEYLQVVERIVGLPFFSDPNLEGALREAPARLPGEALRERAGAYLAGLRILAKARVRLGLSNQAFQTFSEAQLADIQSVYADDIGEVRGELMTIDPGLEPSAVRALRQALSALPQEKPKSPSKEPASQKNDILPPERIPLSAASTIVDITSGSLSAGLRHRRLMREVLKLNLPGHQTSELCITWSQLAAFAGRHGLRDGVQIDWSRLAGEALDEAYAREVQLRHMPSYKLGNVPGMTVAKPSHVPLARPYHASLNRLKTLMGGGAHFAEEWVKQHKLSGEPMQLARGWGYGMYYRLEQLVDIWEAYKRIPVAELDDVPILTLIRRAGLRDRTVFLANKLTPEEAAALLPKRALKPLGRVLLHASKELADQIEAKARRIPLPWHLVPLQALDGIIPCSYSGIHRRVSVLRRKHPDATTQVSLSIIGIDQPVACVDWPTARLALGTDKARIDIDFDRLPHGSDDIDPNKIAYAREIQSRIVVSTIRDGFTPGPELVDDKTRAIQERLEEAEVALGAAVESVESSEDEPDETIEVDRGGEKVATLVDRSTALDPEFEPLEPASKPSLPSSKEKETAGSVWRPGQSRPEQRLPREADAMASFMTIFYDGSPKGEIVHLDAAPPARPARHRPETAGSWSPAPHNGTFISQTARLTAPQIASTLGVPLEVVQAAIKRVDLGDDTPALANGQTEPVYRGRSLLAIREQLVGIPQEYVVHMLKIAPDEWERINTFLKRKGFTTFDDVLSPGCFDFLSRHIAEARAVIT